MVTTRSADKRNNATQDELVLRSKATEQPSPTPGLSRKRATSSTSSPRYKRVRLSANISENDKHGNLQDSDRVVEHSIEGANDATSSSHDQANVLPRTISTSDETISDTTPLQESKADEPTLIQSSDQTTSKFATPAKTAHKRFDSQEPEADAFNYGRNTNQTGTDSSTYQEYQTAEEEIVDSDEAPDVETTRIPSSRPTRGSERTPRVKKSKKSTKEDGIGNTNMEREGDGMTSNLPQSITAEPPSSTNTIPSVHEPTVAATTSSHRPPFAIPDDTTEVSDQQSISAADKALIPPISTPTIIAHSNPFNPSPETTAMEPSEPSSFTAPSLETLPSEFLQLSNNTHQSRFNIKFTPSGSSLRFLDQSQSQSLITTPKIAAPPVLPRKSQTTLSSHRRALLENRTRRSNGAFRLETSWAKKRRSFVV